jgi:hypothetical protein
MVLNEAVSNSPSLGERVCVLRCGEMRDVSKKGAGNSVQTTAWQVCSVCKLTKRVLKVFKMLIVGTTLKVLDGEAS